MFVAKVSNLAELVVFTALLFGEGKSFSKQDLQFHRGIISLFSGIK